MIERKRLQRELTGEEEFSLFKTHIEYLSGRIDRTGFADWLFSIDPVDALAVLDWNATHGVRHNP
ncbi:MAG: hypothetical protein GKR90_25605 [Pseudomonadales bacterium]|nr:hypothetical protein [Pseudomonadales bacterium]